MDYTLAVTHTEAACTPLTPALFLSSFLFLVVRVLTALSITDDRGDQGRGERSVFGKARRRQCGQCFLLVSPVAFKVNYSQRLHKIHI